MAKPRLPHSRLSLNSRELCRLIIQDLDDAYRLSKTNYEATGQLLDPKHPADRATICQYSAAVCNMIQAAKRVFLKLTRENKLVPRQENKRKTKDAD